MRDPNSDKIKVRDELELWNGNRGRVVASIEEGIYLEPCDDRWRYPKKGIRIASEEAGLIHYLEPEAGFKLIGRSSRSSTG